MPFGTKSARHVLPKINRGDRRYGPRDYRSAPQCTAINSIGLRCGHWAMNDADKCQFHQQKEAAYVSTPHESSLEAQDFSSITTGEEFAKAVLGSYEFREYIREGLIKRNLPPTILLRLMDYAEGWGKPTEKVEHTGQEPVTEIRRVIVHPTTEEEEQLVERVVENLPETMH
jgi:hypothetical protein